MHLSDYQEKAKETALYPNVGQNLYYPCLGLAGEVGEILNKIKKVMRDHNGQVTDEFRDFLKDELGDVLWYLATLSTELNLDLSKVAELNVAKLASRKERNVIKGSGDNR
jgi:NTP pyrophosphatase (non-canonical NTP hydrolase)